MMDETGLTAVVNEAMEILGLPEGSVDQDFIDALRGLSAQRDALADVLKTCLPMIRAAYGDDALPAVAGESALRAAGRLP
jgi:hypothetical protein